MLSLSGRVHLKSGVNNSPEIVTVQMLIGMHAAANFSKAHKVVLLAAMQSVFLKMRHDLANQVGNRT